MSILEIPTMLPFYIINNKISVLILLKAATVSFFEVPCHSVSSVGVLYVAQLFQLISYAFYISWFILLMKIRQEKRRQDGRSCLLRCYREAVF